MKPCIKFALVIFVWATVFSVEWVVVVGFAVILHELAHMAVCRMAGIKVFELKALPWGLTASVRLMYEPLTQFAVSVAGPMFNFFLLTLCPLVEKVFSEETAELFALANLADGILNLIPALPLDGGIMLKSLLCSKLGLIRGFSLMLKITAAAGVILMLFGLNVLTVTGSNASYLVAGGFIIYNLKHESELIICIKKKILTGEISSRPITKTLRVERDSHAVCLINMISPSYTLLLKVEKDGEIIGTLTQKKLIHSVMKNSMITVGECVDNKIMY